MIKKKRLFHQLCFLLGVRLLGRLQVESIKGGMLDPSMLKLELRTSYRNRLLVSAPKS